MITNRSPMSLYEPLKTTAQNHGCNRQ